MQASYGLYAFGGPSTAAPIRTQVFVEEPGDAAGKPQLGSVFVPIEAHKVRLEQQRQDSLQKSVVAEDIQRTWGTDPKFYVDAVALAVTQSHRVLEMITGFFAGFSVFFLLSSFAGKKDSTAFLSSFADHFDYTEKAFMFAALFLAVFSLIPFAFKAAVPSLYRDVAADKGPPKIDAGGVALLSRTKQLISAPIHLIGVNFHFFLFFSVVVCNFIVTSAIQDRSSTVVQGLSGSDASRIQGAAIARSALFILAWLTLPWKR